MTVFDKDFYKENALWFMYCNKLTMSKQWNCKTSELLIWVTLTSKVTSSPWCFKYLVFRIVANGRTPGYLSDTFLPHAWAVYCAHCLKEAFEAAHGGRILLLCVPVKKIVKYFATEEDSLSIINICFSEVIAPACEYSRLSFAPTTTWETRREATTLFAFRT